MLDFDFFELLDAVTIARSRKHIQAFYDTSDIGAFPERLQPISIRSPLTDLPEVPSFNEIFEQLSSLTLAVYAPLAYVFPSRMREVRGALRQRPTAGTRGGRVEPRARQPRAGHPEAHDGQPAQAAGELRRGVPPHARAGSQATVDEALQAVDDHAGIDRRPRRRRSPTSTPMTTTSSFRPAALSVGRRSRSTSRTWTSSRGDATSATTARPSRELLAGSSSSPPSTTSSSRALKRLIRDKIANPINPATARCSSSPRSPTPPSYLYRELAPALSRGRTPDRRSSPAGHTPKTTLGKGTTSSRSSPCSRRGRRQRHLVMPKETGEIDMLIGTDCICEGQNLQDCDYLINYDIHWNPVRIIQRFGRIDRIGSTNAQIQLVNFWPDISLDEYINLKERVENRMVIADVAGTADDNVLTPGVQRHRLPQGAAPPAPGRSHRTGRRPDRRLHHRPRPQRLPHGPAQLRQGVRRPRRRAQGPARRRPRRSRAGLRPGVIFALRNVNADETINRSNRLHPYYLVYLDDDGNVIADHTEVKHLLDLIRAGCRAVRRADRRGHAASSTPPPREGAEMGHYSDLLTAAIRSMIDVTEERDLDSLFTGGHDHRAHADHRRASTTSS